MRRRKRLLTTLVILFAVASIAIQLTSPALALSREEQLQQKIQQIISGIPGSVVTQTQKAQYLHDYVVRNVSYEMVGDHQTAYGALLDGKAVCAGYADAYLRLLQAVGIEAVTLTGTADNGSGIPQSHAWTLVKLDGKCLYTDVTWDDPFINGVQDPNHISYDYFNLTREEISLDHFPDASSQQLMPAVCGHTGYDYYSINASYGSGCGIFNDATTAAEAAKYFVYIGKVDGKDSFYCDFRFDGDNGSEWVSNNWTEICRQLGLSGSLSVSYQIGSKALKVTLKGTLSTKVNVTSVTLNRSSLTFTELGACVHLTASVSPENATDKRIAFTSSNPSVATVSEDGLVTAVSEGSAVITVTTADGGKTATCAVTVDLPEPEPTETTAPTEPPTQPTEPPTQPTEPPTNPTEPTEKPTQPTQPTEKPTQPTQPTTIPTEPTQPTTEPTQPASPTEKPTEPTQPTMQPTKPAEPTAPTDQSVPSASSVPTTPSESVTSTAPVMPEGTGQTSVTVDKVTLPTQGTNPPVEPQPSDDPRNIMIFVLCGAAVLIVIVLFVVKKKR